MIHQAELASALDDTLYAVRDQRGPTSYPKSAIEYLNDWAANDKAWLRKFYPPGSDEPHFDLTPATERALAWLGALSERSFVGTESRLLTLFELLRQMSEGSETDPEVRVQELQRGVMPSTPRSNAVRAGDLPLLGDTALKERFTQFATLARELLADFREVEHNFRGLDRRVRERIALWDGSKGALLQDILGERDAIDESDQGRSFRAFWDFLMSRDRQDELSALLERVLAAGPPWPALEPDPRLRRVHYDWLEAGEHTQRTVALLSQQLRRFLDDQAWLENRRIMDILRSIEAKALAVRDAAAGGRLHGHRRHRAEHRPADGAPAALPGRRSCDCQRAHRRPATRTWMPRRCIRSSSSTRSHWRSTSAQRCSNARRSRWRSCWRSRPLQQGLAELVAYLRPGRRARQSSDRRQRAGAGDLAGAQRAAQDARSLPRVIFTK